MRIRVARCRCNYCSTASQPFWRIDCEEHPTQMGTTYDTWAEAMQAGVIHHYEHMVLA